MWVRFCSRWPPGCFYCQKKIKTMSCHMHFLIPSKFYLLFCSFRLLPPKLTSTIVPELQLNIKQILSTCLEKQVKIFAIVLAVWNRLPYRTKTSTFFCSRKPNFCPVIYSLLLKLNKSAHFIFLFVYGPRFLIMP